MVKYFIKAHYTVQGVQGLLKEGGSARVEAASKVAGSLGGKLDFLYFTAGAPTFYGVFTLPDPASAACLASTVISTGTVTVDECVPILNGEEMDEAVRKSISYRAPGQ